MLKCTLFIVLAVTAGVVIADEDDVQNENWQSMVDYYASNNEDKFISAANSKNSALVSTHLGELKSLINDSVQSAHEVSEAIQSMTNEMKQILDDKSDSNRLRKILAIAQRYKKYYVHKELYYYKANQDNHKILAAKEWINRRIWKIKDKNLSYNLQRISDKLSIATYTMPDLLADFGRTIQTIIDCWDNEQVVESQLEFLTASNDGKIITILTDVRNSIQSLIRQTGGASGGRNGIDFYSH